MGARPMARLINERVKKPLAKELLFGNEIRTVNLEILDDTINIRTN
jgi:ATP-dependent Clp protease ATP-binding subunit ClpA